MFVCEILHVYADGHFVVVVLVNNKKFDFNPIVNFEIVSNSFEKLNQFIYLLIKQFGIDFPQIHQQN